MMIKRAMSPTRMMMMRTKVMLKKSRRNQRSLDTFHLEGFQIHLKKQLKSRSNFCRQERMHWLSIPIYLKTGSSRMNHSH
jgi:hypothetical protein